ncbi:unnamed protein product [Lymnaea stagnalis]|uniref:Transmembrane protein 241 n=1 Tax=Lymnaea stagnalis TaxID=6523 RepID=A0AAV2HWC2_LYMST
MKLGLMFTCLFVVLFISTTFVNKYVLSVLRFTYPTIFQGWQTLVGVIMFRALLSTGHIDGFLHGKEWHECALWLPGMMSFLLSIYSGSRALANLPIPVYLVMQNIVLVFKATSDLMFHKQITSPCSYFMLMLSLSSALFVAKTDPQYDPDGYHWMCVHVLSLGFFESYTNLIHGRLKLRAPERLFCCYFYSVIVLAPSSYFLGDALEAVKFPYFYFAQFYVGCIFSGVFGMLLSLCTIRLHEMKTPYSILDANTVQSAAKILCSCASLAFYDIEMSYTFFFFTAVNLFSSFGYCESSSHRRQPATEPQVIKSPDTNPGLKDVEMLQFLKRHELQQDMIRLDLG